MTNYPKNLKYPYSNYTQLLQVLKQLARYFDVFDIQPSQLHYVCYQQTSNGQLHNRIYLTDEGLKRRHSMLNTDVKKVDNGQLKPIVNVDFELELYPNDCNDNHIESAVKRAVKEIAMDGSIKKKQTA